MVHWGCKTGHVQYSYTSSSILIVQICKNAWLKQNHAVISTGHPQNPCGHNSPNTLRHVTHSTR